MRYNMTNKGSLFGKIKKTISAKASHLFSPHTKRKILLSSLVGYFLKIDQMDDNNIQRINKLMHICNYSFEAMRLPMMLGPTIWQGIDPGEIVSTKSEETAQELLLRNVPEWLRYGNMANDIREFIGQMRKGNLVIKH